MAMNNQLLAVVQHIENERGVSREVVLTAIESAILQAAEKNVNVTNDLKVVIDRKDLSLHVYDKLVCSDEETGPGFISLAAAARYNHGNLGFRPVANAARATSGGVYSGSDSEWIEVDVDRSPGLIIIAR